MNKEKVAIIETTYKNVEGRIGKIFELLDYKPKKKKVLLKPNIVSPRNKDSPVITNPKLMDALVKYLKKYFEEIIIGEGSVAGTPTSKSFKAAGYYELAEKHGIKLLDFNTADRVAINWKYGKIMVPKILLTHEYINVAKMKTHIQTTVSLAAKNQKGILLPNDKKKFHKSTELNERIKALNRALQPDLNIIDAIVCIEGNGPGAEGKEVRLNRVLASQNIFAIDNAALQVMNIHPDKVSHLIQKDFEFVGDLKVSKHKFRLPDEYYHKLRLRMWFNDSCSGCNQNIFSAIKGLPKKHPFKTLKFLYNVTVNQTNVIAGPNHKKCPKGGHIICVGSCTMALAKKKGYVYINGCPPKIKEIMKRI